MSKWGNWFGGGRSAVMEASLSHGDVWRQRDSAFFISWCVSSSAEDCTLCLSTQSWPHHTTLHYLPHCANLYWLLSIFCIWICLFTFTQHCLSLSLFSVVCNPLVYFVLSFFLLPLVTNKQQHCVVSLLPGHSYSTCIWPIYTTPCTATHSLLRHTLHAEEHHPGLFSCWGFAVSVPILKPTCIYLATLSCFVFFCLLWLPRVYRTRAHLICSCRI